jgi:hypothetical protein
MKNAKHPSMLVAAVLAGLPAVTAFGQARLNTNGHLLDANNQVGSGGLNGGHTVQSQNFNGDIWTGNVSGLNYFHGRQTEIDPGIIKAGTGTENSDTLTRESAPVNNLQRTTGTPNYSTFVPTARADVAYSPTDFKTTANGEGYIPAPRLDPLVPDTNTRIDPGSVAGQSTLSTQGNNGPAGPVSAVAVPKAGNDSLYDLSPLYGVRKSDGAIDGSDAYSLRTGAVQNNTPNVNQLRDELNKNPVDDGNGNATSGNGKPADGGAAGATNLTNTQQVGNTGPFNDAVASQSPLSNAVGGSQQTTSLQTGESFINNKVIPPERQSAQLAQLMRKYSQEGKPANAIEAAERNNKINALVNAATAKQPNGPEDLNPMMRTNGPGTGTIGTGTTATGTTATGAPGAGAPGSVPPVTPQHDKTAPPAATPTEHPAVDDSKPMVITSLATGMSAGGMSNLMKQAEEKMRAGKFTDAANMYDSAERVAPNNPFIPLGRGFAELGSSYYAKADADLGQAVAEQPAILDAQYDLKGFLGDTRLQFVQKDLADMSGSEKSARPEVLLAFIAHNTGDDAAAASHLDAATARGGETALVAAMRSVWKMPAKAEK